MVTQGEERTAASRLYDAAYEMHHSNNNLPKAFTLYKDVILDYPNSKEAGYADSQIHTIVNTVVPEEERLSIQMDLAAARYNNSESTDDDTDVPGREFSHGR